MTKITIILTALLATAIFCFSCKETQTTPINAKTYVLVHGAWHGKWAWNKVSTELEKQGHKVIAIDLPGHGDDKTPMSQVTLDSYIAKITETLDQQSEKVILVGHSMGGIPISGAAEKRPEKIEKLVYLAAFLPQNGESLFSLEGRNPKPTLPPNLIPSADQSYFDVKKDMITSLFYGDCSAADVQFALSKLTPQAVAPLATPVSLSKEKFGTVPRYYIECVNDNAISIGLQRDMHTASPCQKIFTLQTSHSPFFSAPDQLVQYFAQINQ